MTASEFIKKWRKVHLTERSASQQHFLDLCALVGHPTPAAADPEGASFTFERGVHKRTLTNNLYNDRPTWLALAQTKLDEAVFAAYGWDPALSDEAILEKLLELNLERAGQQERSL